MRWGTMVSMSWWIWQIRTSSTRWILQVGFTQMIDVDPCLASGRCTCFGACIMLPQERANLRQERPLSCNSLPIMCQSPSQTADFCLCERQPVLDWSSSHEMLMVAFHLLPVVVLGVFCLWANIGTAVAIHLPQHEGSCLSVADQIQPTCVMLSC